MMTILLIFLIFLRIISSYSFFVLPTVEASRDSYRNIGIAHHPQLDQQIEAQQRMLPPIVYTIAGSDSGGGAGIQADLHTIRAFGCHSCSAITCLTAQNSMGVTDVHFLPASFLKKQLETLNEDLPPVAIKIGMLGTKDLALQVGKFLKDLKVNSKQKVWIVLDPVMISTSGHRLIDEDAKNAMIQHIFPFTDILTPNKFEAEALLEKKLLTIDDVEKGAFDIIRMGVESVLIKGGHTLDLGHGGNWAQDYFLSSDSPSNEPRLCDGSRGVWFRSPRYQSDNTHGTGCTLSSAIASALALGEKERSYDIKARRGVFSSIQAVDACCLAKAYVTAGIDHGVQLGKGPGPVAQTSFPSFSRYFPSIALDPNTDSPNFLAMSTFDSLGIICDDSENQPMLSQVLPIVDSVNWVQRLCSIDGVKDIQLRIKGETNIKNVAELVQECQKLCHEAGKRLWINDFWEAAVDANCFGVHLGQEDLFRCVQTGGLKMLQNKNMALGVSTHSYGELAAALGVQPTYISLGPIFATNSKNVNSDPQGLETVAKWRQLLPSTMPLVVIGGINEREITAKVKRAGADCVAVIGAVIHAENVTNAMHELNTAMALE